ncbi:MAG: 5'-3' exonuclease H3TH domain-containing protein [Opitutaceae bacterium]
MKKWLLIDGFNLAYRCFFAIPELTRADGFPTNALHGWIKSIWRLQDQEKPNNTMVFFDLGGAQDRLLLLPEYKAQREEMPEALVKQLPYLKALTRAMGLVGVEREGVESDDLLAAEAAALARKGDEVLIVSSDKDFAQLVSDKISILLPPPTANPKLGWRRMDASGVMEKFGVPPSMIADYLALVGDASDNIPGVNGVGPKTAAKWLQSYGGLEQTIANAECLEPARFREVVRDEAEKLRRNLKITTLNLSLEPVSGVDQTVQLAEILRLLEEMEMRSALAEARNRYLQPELF